MIPPKAHAQSEPEELPQTADRVEKVTHVGVYPNRGMRSRANRPLPAGEGMEEKRRSDEGGVGLHVARDFWRQSAGTVADIVKPPSCLRASLNPSTPSLRNFPSVP